MFKLELGKTEEPEIKLPTSIRYQKSKRVPEKHLLLYWLHQSLWLCGSKQTGKFLKRWEYQTTFPASWEIRMQVKEIQLELDMKQQTVQIGKGGCICSPSLFSFYTEYIMWNTRVNEAQAGIKIDGRNTSNLRYTDDTILMFKKSRRTKEPLDESEKGEKNLA